MEKTKKIYQFKGLSKAQKNDLKKAYFKREWKNLLMSYLFIILSSSKPILSRNNGAIYVSIWFTLSIILSVYFYVNQSDYMSRKRNAEKYIKKHKSAEVEIGSVFFPEIGGWGFIGMQFLVTNVVFLPFLPLPIYLQFKSFETYKEVYMELFIGVFADTVILVFFNGILQHIIDSIYDYSNGITTMKKTKISLTKKNTAFLIGATIILYKAFSHYFNKEFEGLFGDMRRIIGGIYILFMLYPLIKSIRKVIIKNRISLNIMKKLCNTE